MTNTKVKLVASDGSALHFSTQDKGMYKIKLGEAALEIDAFGNTILYLEIVKGSMEKQE